jgi:nanoRNase/pAp phosphatase (c-di-AMP/oligoRNAs hydrolase)
LGQVRSFQVWAMFIQQKEDGEIHYNGSLRSRRVIVNDIANKYGGGGHKLAAAVKKLDDVAIEHLLEDLRQRIKEQS